jgi:ATP phosphoribosyltransferase regulatory subunit HisZ
VADHFVGRTRRSSLEYGLVYRGVNHKALRDLCLEVQKVTLPARYRGYEPAGGLGPNIRAFAAGVIQLQDARHAADYDPLLRFKTADARLAISTGRSALTRFARASARRRGRFLSLLLFSPR